MGETKKEVEAETVLEKLNRLEQNAISIAYGTSATVELKEKSNTMCKDIEGIRYILYG